jgi:iron-sulfur cluster assembly protein
MSEVDEVYFSEGNLRIVSDKVSSVFLDGLTVDFSNDLIEPGFRLTNANAKGSCGCGSSFSTGDPAPNVDVSFSV